MSANGESKDLLRDGDLDLDEYRRSTNLSAANGREAPKLVHASMLSMPAGTPPDKVLAAARVFGREHLALEHRYVMALHTDEPHPHVHMVVKAVSEQGMRLNIRKATLCEWSRDFARSLRGPRGRGQRNREGGSRTAQDPNSCRNLSRVAPR